MVRQTEKSLWWKFNTGTVNEKRKRKDKQHVKHNDKWSETVQMVHTLCRCKKKKHFQTANKINKE
jgi:hypothetical protein